MAGRASKPHDGSQSSVLCLELGTVFGTKMELRQCGTLSVSF